MKNIILIATFTTLFFSCKEIKSKFGNTNDVITDHTIVNCDYTNLSNQNNYKFIVNYNATQNSDEIEYIVQILDKSNKVLETVKTQSKIDPTLLEKIKVCENVKSLSTQHNLTKNFDGLLYDGNFVIGDFNFDGKDDVAIYSRKDENSGKFFYDYFLQKQDGKFEKDTFLSDDTDYLGKKYDVKDKTVVLQNNESIKKFAFENNQWFLKEELKDPFPKANKLGVINLPNKFPKDGLKVYDKNFKPVGKISSDLGGEDISVIVIFPLLRTLKSRVFI